ncbi:TetR family transcriptional regulator [bacterium]|nr:TetR family transcriptional regulator [bacterium]
MARSKSFDEQEVVTRAMFSFLERGYEATSLSALEKATGVDRKGLYNTFGDKEGLFVVALQRFIETGSARHILFTESEGAAFPEIVSAFEFIVAHSQTEMGQYGCLACNSLREPIGESPNVQPILQGYLTRVQSAFHSALTNELDGFAIPTPLIDKLAHSLVGTFVGAFVLARAPVSVAVLVDFVELALGQLNVQLQALKSGNGLASVDL